VRVDHALETGGTIPTHYDSMIAKLVAHGRTREEARQKLLRAVQDCVLLGVPSNQPFLASCLASAAFTGNDVHTGFVDAHMQASLQPAEPSRHVIAIAALAASGQLSRSEPAALSRMTTSVRLHAEGDRGNRQWRRQKKAGALPSARGETGAQSVHVRMLRDHAADGAAWIECDGMARPVLHADDDLAIHLFADGRAWRFTRHDPRRRNTEGESSGASPRR
jgi:geranyl-CoA carboxylase alpha subunit